ncbi:type VI secretion system lipoprotein TssJ [Zoogloea ramigera]|uniref:type VI secretion system lipoprotein TssJ n=1 Tax=Zoogloea ramigera TaxID=350 RepID=UPI003FA1B7BD
MGIPFSHTENQPSWRGWGWVAVSPTLLAWLPACAARGAVGAPAGAIDRVMDVAGVGKGRDAESNKPIEVAMKIHAGERLNASGSGQPLSLVLRVYSLRSAERLKALAYARLSAPEGEREALGEDLVAVRELVLLPGKSYALALKMPGETSTIGVTGLFRAPYADRWKLAFDARKSADSGIVIGAHACALTASAGTLVTDSGPAASLVGVQCNR